jgi:hypothetical protein
MDTKKFTSVLRKIIREEVTKAVRSYRISEMMQKLYSSKKKGIGSKIRYNFKKEKIEKKSFFEN